MQTPASAGDSTLTSGPVLGHAWGPVYTSALIMQRVRSLHSLERPAHVVSESVQEHADDKEEERGGNPERDRDEWVGAHESERRAQVAQEGRRTSAGRLGSARLGLRPPPDVLSGHALPLRLLGESVHHSLELRLRHAARTRVGKERGFDSRAKVRRAGRGLRMKRERCEPCDRNRDCNYPEHVSAECVHGFKYSRKNSRPHKLVRA